MFAKILPWWNNDKNDLSADDTLADLNQEVIMTIMV